MILDQLAFTFFLRVINISFNLKVISRDYIHILRRYWLMELVKILRRWCLPLINFYLMNSTFSSRLYPFQLFITSYSELWCILISNRWPWFPKFWIDHFISILSSWDLKWPIIDHKFNAYIKIGTTSVISGSVVVMIGTPKHPKLCHWILSMEEM